MMVLLELLRLMRLLRVLPFQTARAAVSTAAAK